mmetsp:Transcript_9992/g.21499  ORF Transcript_9992/g.21499 Transcript_9992/m.21499 type:complete len:82 (-) Transcript_9992:2563-2808(-)
MITDCSSSSKKADNVVVLVAALWRWCTVCIPRILINANANANADVDVNNNDDVATAAAQSPPRPRIPSRCPRIPRRRRRRP